MRGSGIYEVSLSGTAYIQQHPNNKESPGLGIVAELNQCSHEEIPNIKNARARYQIMLRKRWSSS